MRRLLPLATLLLATLAATPASAWDRRPHHGGWGWRPAPSWHHPHQQHRWYRPWRAEPGWRQGGHDDRRYGAWRHPRDVGWGQRRGW